MTRKEYHKLNASNKLAAISRRRHSTARTLMEMHLIIQCNAYYDTLPHQEPLRKYRKYLERQSRRATRAS